MVLHLFKKFNRSKVSFLDYFTMKTFKLCELVGLSLITISSLLFLPSFFEFAKVVNFWTILCSSIR